MTTIGLEKLEHNELSDTNWIIPSILTSGQLQESLDLLKKYTDDPISFEDGKLPEDLIKRKQKARKAFDSDDDEDDNQEEYLFEPGGPTAMKPVEKKPRKLVRKKRIRADAEDEGVSDELAKERQNKRLERERLKRQVIKSDMYVRHSDDESDPEKQMAFLLREKKQRESVLKSLTGENTSAPLLVVGTDPGQYPTTKKRKKSEKEKRVGGGKKKRKAIQESDEEEEEVLADDEDDEAIISREASPLISNTANLTSDDESNGPYDMGPIRISDGDDSDGPYTMGPIRVSNEDTKGAGSPKVPYNDVIMNDPEEDEEEDAIPRPSRGRRGPVVIDSDSE